MANGTPTPFQAGPRLVDGNDLNTAFSDPTTSWENGITALAGGGRTGAPTLTRQINHIGTVATAADSVQLPVANVGKKRYVYNSAANACQIFANGSDTINATAGNTGVSLAGGKSAEFFCAKAGVWSMILSA